MSGSNHNGGTVWAAAAVEAWNGTQEDLPTLLNYSGTGNGCYVRAEVNYASKREFSFDMFGAVPYQDIDNGPSMRAAIKAAQNTLLPSSVVFEGYYTAKTPLGSITKPISIHGAGRRNSIIFFDSTDDDVVFLYVDDVGFSNESTEQPITGNKAYPLLQNIKSGFGMFDFQITGNRAKQQHCVIFRGNCDNVTMENIDISYFNGRGLLLGGSLNNSRGNVREGFFKNVVLRHCGKLDSTSAFRIEKNESPAIPSIDSVNLCVFVGVQIIFPYGRGLDIVGVRGTTTSSPLYGLQFTVIILHGRRSTS